MAYPTPIFPTPSDAVEPPGKWGIASALAHSTSSVADIARKNIDEWISHWPSDDDAELLGNLTSNRDSQVQASCWELYVNSLLRSLNFRTKKLNHREGMKTPDFLVTKDSKSFYVEAAVRNPDEDMLWESLVVDLKQVKRSDYTIFLSLELRGAKRPSSKRIADQIQKRLDQFVETAEPYAFSAAQEFEVSSDGWTLKAAPLALRGTAEMEMVAAHSSGSLMPINDDIALRAKIEEKRKKYKDLDFPLVLAILENSFSVSDAYVHRFDALFGSSTLQVFSDGRTKLGRDDNGLWTRTPRKKDCAALLLSHSSPLTRPNSEAPELWINPQLETDGINLFSVPVVYGKTGEKYGPLGSKSESSSQ
jgi:hypothetical protein